MPTLMIHHRKRLVLQKLTNYVRTRRQILNSLTLGLGDLDNLTQEAEDEDDDFPLPPGADIPFDRIPFMTKQERERLQHQFSNFPPYMFMTEKQKRVFFKKRTEEFNKKIIEVPQKKSKTKKIVKFQNNFEVRPFRKTQTATQITKTKSFIQTYQEYHFS